jgi:outer membrane lipoprotein-sorting protein
MIEKFSLKNILAGILALVLVTATGAAAAPLSDGDRETVARAETFLNSIRTLTARFVQTTDSGEIAEGKLYLARPGNLRIDYAPPSSLRLYANDTWLVYIDSELKDVSQVPVNLTPAAFLIRDQIKFSGDLTVLGLDRKPGTISIRLARSDDPDATRLTLIFGVKLKTLLGWAVLDAQGIETTISLHSVTTNAPLDPKLFVYDVPDWAPEQED